MQRIYLDANATTPVLPEVVDAMRPYWQERFGNASAVHGFGRGARAAVEGAREQVATLLNARPSEIVFTSGGTESDNQALFGLLGAGDHLVVSAIEHDAVLHAADALRASRVEVTQVPPDCNGVVQAEAVEKAMTSRTKLVSVMLANNETGVVQPVASIAAAAHRAGAWMHTDAVQACGKIPLNVEMLGCDLLSVSGHKMHGPQGVGALWVRSGVPVRPLLHGGGHERRRRAGTENVPGLAGLGRAAGMAKDWMASGAPAQVCALRERFESTLLNSLSDVTVNGGNADRLPNTANLCFAGIQAEELVIALDMQGVAASGGSACQSGTIEPSHVLRAMGLSDAEARSSVRFSMSRSTTAEEVDTAASIIVGAVTRMHLLRPARF